MDKDKKVFL